MVKKRLSHKCADNRSWVGLVWFGLTTDEKSRVDVGFFLFFDEGREFPRQGWERENQMEKQEEKKRKKVKPKLLMLKSCTDACNPIPERGTGPEQTGRR